MRALAPLLAVALLAGCAAGTLPAKTAEYSGGYWRFCQKHTANCPKTDLRAVKWSPALVDGIKTAAASVRASVSWVEEPTGQDVWQCSGEGDCEDHAICTRALLRAQGLPASAMRIGVAKMYTGTGHAFLGVYTTKGWYVVHWGYAVPLDKARIEAVYLEGGDYTPGYGYQFVRPHLMGD